MRRVPPRGGGVPAAGLIGIAVLGWVVLLAVARVWGTSVVADAPGDLHVGAVPLYGSWDPEVTWRVLVPVLAGAAGAVLLPRLAARTTWPRLLVLAGLGAVVWSLALAVVDPGDSAFTDIRQAYGRHTGLVDEYGGPGAFLRDYVEQQDSVPVHLQAHPPGLVLALWAAAKAGLAGPGWHAVLAMAGVAAAAVAVSVITRDVAGERFARAAVPFVAIAPAAVWHTNADVVFGGLALAGVALVVLATRAAISWPVVGLAVGGGVLFGVALLLSYGVALLAVPIAVIVVWRRRWRVLAVSAAAGAVVVLLPLAWGFWWLDGLAATREQYYAGVGADRPYSYFLVANLAVFALALGPAAVAGLAVLRQPRVWLVVGSGLAAVALADLSGMSSAETERIWQPFMPLVLVAGGALAGSVRQARGWLAVQVALAVVVQTALRSPW